MWMFRNKNLKRFNKPILLSFASVISPWFKSFSELETKPYKKLLETLILYLDNEKYKKSGLITEFLMFI